MKGGCWDLIRSPLLFNIGLTRLRTFNGPSLIERCHRAWRHNQTIHLEYRDPSGLENQAPILAARALDRDEGQMLLLWVRQEIDLDEIDPDLDDLGDDDDPGSSTDWDLPNH